MGRKFSSYTFKYLTNSLPNILDRKYSVMSLLRKLSLSDTFHDILKSNSAFINYFKNDSSHVYLTHTAILHTFVFARNMFQNSEILGSFQFLNMLWSLNMKSFLRYNVYQRFILSYCRAVRIYKQTFLEGNVEYQNFWITCIAHSWKEAYIYV